VAGFVDQMRAADADPGLRRRGSGGDQEGVGDEEAY
jgi:hypothetical protein